MERGTATTLNFKRLSFSLNPSPTFSQTISNWEERRGEREGVVPLFFPENGPINSARPLLLEKEVYTGRHKAFSSFPHLRSLGAVPSYIFFLSFLPLPFPPLAGLFSFNVYNDLANLPRDLSLPLQHSGNLYSTRYSSVSPLFVLYLFFFFWRDWRDGDGE